MGFCFARPIKQTVASVKVCNLCPLLPEGLSIIQQLRKYNTLRSFPLAAVEMAATFATHATCTSQVALRGFQCRRAYSALLSRRQKAAMILQLWCLRRMARALAQGLRGQQHASWEELYDKQHDRLYYYCKVRVNSGSISATPDGTTPSGDISGPRVAAWVTRGW